MSRAWVVRPYPHHIYRMQEFLDENMIAIGWPGIGDLSDLISREDFKEALRTPDSSPGELGQATGNLFRFVRELEPADYVLVPDDRRGDVYFGVVTSDYMYVVDDEERSCPHQRNVNWKNSVPRQLLTGGNWSALRGRLTVFEFSHLDDVRGRVLTRHGR